MVVIALNVLSGNIKPEQWRGFRRVDEDDEALLDLFQEIRQWGFGKLEVNISGSKIDMAYRSHAYKRRDLIKSPVTT
jgi:hypothetical protein